MKQLILNLSQRLGKYTNDLTVIHLHKRNMNRCLLLNRINNKQIKFHNYLMRKWKTGKSLNLK